MFNLASTNSSSPNVLASLLTPSSASTAVAGVVTDNDGNFWIAGHYHSPTSTVALRNLDGTSSGITLPQTGTTGDSSGVLSQGLLLKYARTGQLLLWTRIPVTYRTFLVGTVAFDSISGDVFIGGNLGNRTDTTPVYNMSSTNSLGSSPFSLPGGDNLVGYAIRFGSNGVAKSWIVSERIDNDWLQYIYIDPTNGDIYTAARFQNGSLGLPIYNFSSTSTASNTGISIPYTGATCVALVRYNNAGQFISWATISNSGSDLPTVVRTTADYIYVGGYYTASSTATISNFSSTNSISNSSMSLPVASANSGFTIRWNKSTGVAHSFTPLVTSTASAVVYSIEEDPIDNSIYIAGYYTGAPAIRNFTSTTGSFVSSASLPTAAGTYDGFIIKYSPAGTMISWTTIQGTGSDLNIGLMIDPVNGDLYSMFQYVSTGAVNIRSFSSTSSLGAVAFTIPASAVTSTCFLKYSSTGTPLSRTVLKGTSNIIPTRVNFLNSQGFLAPVVYTSTTDVPVIPFTNSASIDLATATPGFYLQGTSGTNVSMVGFTKSGLPFSHFSSDGYPRSAGITGLLTSISSTALPGETFNVATNNNFSVTLGSNAQSLTFQLGGVTPSEITAPLTTGSNTIELKVVNSTSTAETLYTIQVTNPAPNQSSGGGGGGGGGMGPIDPPPSNTSISNSIVYMNEVTNSIFTEALSVAFENSLSKIGFTTGLKDVVADIKNSSYYITKDVNSDFTQALLLEPQSLNPSKVIMSIVTSAADLSSTLQSKDVGTIIFFKQFDESDAVMSTIDTIVTVTVPNMPFRTYLSVYRLEGDSYVLVGTATRNSGQEDVYSISLSTNSLYYFVDSDVLDTLPYNIEQLADESTISVTVADIVGGGINTNNVTLTKFPSTGTVQTTTTVNDVINKVSHSPSGSYTRALAIFPNTWRTDVSGYVSTFSFATKFIDPADLTQFVTSPGSQSYTIEIPDLYEREYLKIYREGSDGLLTFVSNATVIEGQSYKYQFSTSLEGVFTIVDSGVYKNNMSSLQALIDAASSGATISLSGSYADATTVTINKPLTIVGRASPSSGSRPVVTITTAANASGINVDASNVTIRGVEIIHSSTYSSNDTCITLSPGGTGIYPDSGVPVNENIVIDDCKISYSKFGVSSKAKYFNVVNSEIHNRIASNTTGRSIAMYYNNGNCLINNNTYTTAGNLAIEGLHMNYATNDSYLNERSGTITYTNNTSAIATTRKFIFFEVGAEVSSSTWSMVISNNTISTGTGSAFFVLQPSTATSFNTSIGSITIANNTISGTFANGIAQVDVTYGSAKTHNTLTVTPIFYIYGNTTQTGIVSTGKTILENVMAFTGYTSLPGNIAAILSTSAPAPPSDPIVNQVFTTVTSNTTSLTVAELIGGSNSTSVTLTKVSDNAANVAVTYGSGTSLNRLILVNSADIPLQKAFSVFPNTWRSNIDGKVCPVSFAVKFVDPSDLMSFATPVINQNYTIELPELTNRAYVAIYRENSDGSTTFVTNAGLIAGQVCKYSFTLESNSIYTVADTGVLTAGLASQIVNKFVEMADVYNEDGSTHFHGRIYDNAELRGLLESRFNDLYTQVGNLVEAANSATVTISGDLMIDPEDGYTGPLTISTNSLVYFVHVLLNETVSGYDTLASFDRTTATTFEGLNTMRENFMSSFIARVQYYFNNLSISVPTSHVYDLLVDYLKPVQKRSRMLAMAALTGTTTTSTTQLNPVDSSNETNTMQLKDSQQVWNKYAVLTIGGTNATFESTVQTSIPISTYENIKLNTRLYEQSLTLGSGANWGPASANQDPYAFGKRFLGLKASIGNASQDAWLKKMLQIWNLARVHNNAYDADHGVVSTKSDGSSGSFAYTTPGNSAAWDGSTVDALQLEYYTIFGYGPTYEQLHNSSGFWTAVSEPAGTELYTGAGSAGYIEKVLLDKIRVYLRLNEFANDIRPSQISDSLEQLGWVAFVEGFLRYYLWSANNAQSGSASTEETSYTAKMVSFFSAYDTSVAGTSQTRNAHIEAAATSAIGNATSAKALVSALSQVRAYSDAGFWAAVTTKRLNHLPYHVVWDGTENMVAQSAGTALTQGLTTLIATFNNLVDFYPRTLTSDKISNSLLPDVFDWYKIVGYLAAVPQELPADGSSAYTSDVGFGRISRTTFPFVALQTMGPQAFFDELCKRLFYIHKSSGMLVPGSLNSDHTGASAFDVDAPGAVLGAYDSAADSYTTGFKALVNVNNYYKMLRQENDLRLAKSNASSEYDLEDLERIFDNAYSLLDAQKTALTSVTTTITQDMTDLTNTLESYYDPYQVSSAVKDLQLRYVQLSSENRAQGVLEATYQAFATLLTSVRSVSESVANKQLTYQQLLTQYNAQFDSYLNNYQQWNTLIQRAEDLFGGATTYMDLLQARLDLIASVGALRAKFNADVSQVKSIITAVQQTFLSLKAQGVRTIGNYATGSTFQMNGVTYTKPRAALGSFSVENFLNFVPK